MADTVPIRRPSSILDHIKEMQDQITQRAYEIFERNGSMPGRDLENWTQAERELVWKPALELNEKDGHFRIEVAIAGVDANDINVEVTADDIVLTTNTEHRHTDQKSVVHYCEFAPGRMFRAIHMPKQIDPDKVRAEFKDGMLRLTAQVAQEVSALRTKSEAA
jgi:HSP20 family molecular chaperone IbpA